MKETPRLILSLSLVAALAGLLLALVASMTRGPIEQARARAFTEELRRVLPPGLPDPEERTVVLADGRSNTVYVAEGAVAMEARSVNGYAGEIRLLVGFTADGILHDYAVLDHKETPGLGAHVTGRFRAAVTNRPAGTTDWRVRKDGGDIDSITAATISSRAVCEAIADAVSRLAEIQTRL